MPHIVVHLSGNPDATLARRAAEAVARLTRDILGKAPEVIAIAVQYVPTDAWFIGGRTLAELGRRAFHLDISVTDETNTKAEKARYIAAVHAAFGELLGDLHECSYVHVIDARAAAYGYGGRTQEYRHQRAETHGTPADGGAHVGFQGAQVMGRVGQLGQRLRAAHHP